MALSLKLSKLLTEFFSSNSHFFPDFCKNKNYKCKVHRNFLSRNSNIMCQNKIKTACSIGKIDRDRKKNQTYLRTKKERTSLLSTSSSSLSADRTTDDTCISTKYSCNIQFCLNCDYLSRKDKFEQSDLCDKELTTQNNMEHSNCIYSHASTSQKISTHQMQTTQHYSMSQRTMHTETQLNNSKGFHSHKKGANASNKHQTGKNTMSRSKFHNLAKAIANARKKNSF